MKMQRLMHTTLLASGLLLAAGVQAQDPKPEAPADKLSYAIGLNIGMNLKAQNFEVDPSVIAQGMRDAIAGKPALTEEEARTAIMTYQQELRAKAETKRQEASKANHEAGEAFLAENAKKDGVKIKEVTLPDGKTAQLQYKVLVEGQGEIPKENHQVTVNYRGTLIDGTEFDSSYKRGEPASFPVGGVIRGWTEALQLMKPGAKWELYIPSDLAYGENAPPNIGPNSVLVFEVELLSVKPAPTPEPITSDIIRVPSAEEIKRGAKPETIKMDQIEKELQKQQQQQQQDRKK